MMKSLILGNSNSCEVTFLCITKIFDLVSLSKLGFSDINMSATYAKKKKKNERTCGSGEL